MPHVGKIVLEAFHHAMSRLIFTVDIATSPLTLHAVPTVGGPRRQTHSRHAANALWRSCQPSCVVSCIYTLCLSFEDVGKIVLARPRYTLHAGRKVERFLVLTPENKLEACCLYMSLHSGHELSLSASDRADLALYSQVSRISPDTIT